MAPALPSPAKVRHFYFSYLLMVICISCNTTPPLIDYGVISSETDSIPTIDTGNNDVRPVTLMGRLYHLTNKSTNHKIDFVCKAYLKDEGGVLSEKAEKHIVAPQETINLDIDSNNNQKLLKYEIVSAAIVNK